MRSPSEINQAISYLKDKGGQIAAEQIKVISTKMTESQVFKTYVVNVGEENKDEALYFAAREAAQYIAGKLAIEDLIPDYKAIIPVVQDVTEKANTITLSKEEFDTLMKRFDDQEQRILKLEKRIKSDREILPKPFAAKNMINQRQACALLGIGLNVVKRYCKEGLLTPCVYGRNVYYLKKEVEQLKKEKQDGYTCN